MAATDEVTTTEDSWDPDLRAEKRSVSVPLTAGIIVLSKASSTELTGDAV
jgi:hypothetical protein